MTAGKCGQRGGEKKRKRKPNQLVTSVMFSAFFFFLNSFPFLFFLVVSVIFSLLLALTTSGGKLGTLGVNYNWIGLDTACPVLPWFDFAPSLLLLLLLLLAPLSSWPLAFALTSRYITPGVHTYLHLFLYSGEHHLT
ncbi:hypothetical protein F4810DRAFT_111140 [Camillea tinctor]|nr:hypothetical protein F4810DRAFT_111140 [Camillea tinctor]